MLWLIPIVAIAIVASQDSPSSSTRDDSLARQKEAEEREKAQRKNQMRDEFTAFAHAEIKKLARKFGSSNLYSSFSFGTLCTNANSPSTLVSAIFSAPLSNTTLNNAALGKIADEIREQGEIATYLQQSKQLDNELQALLNLRSIIQKVHGAAIDAEKGVST